MQASVSKRDSVGQRALRVLKVSLVSAALVGLGLVVTGREGEALRLVRFGTGSGLSLRPMPGSQAGPAVTVTSAGRPERARYCTTPRSVIEIIEHYEDFAKRDSRVLEGQAKGPYLRMVDEQLGMLGWVNKSGKRIGVVAYPVAEGMRSRYVLFEGGEAPPLVSESEAGLRPTMPLGISAPGGTEVIFDFRRAGQDMAYYRMPGEPGTVVGDLRHRLKKAGYKLEASQAHALKSVGEVEEMAVLPFRRGTAHGYLSIRKGAEPGESVVSLFLRK